MDNKNEKTNSNNNNNRKGIDSKGLFQNNRMALYIYYYLQHIAKYSEQIECLSDEKS